ALNKRGLTAASRSFTVTGTVKLRSGEVKKRQRLLAFDLDLRGVAVYRSVKNIAEIKKAGDFEFLGQTVSDNHGNYRITFYDWQYAEAERKKADVVVYALEGEEIIGRSRMVNSEDYSDKGLVRGLDIIITAEDKRTEYEALMSELNAFLKESKTNLSEIAKSRDQLVFTAGELDVGLSRINIAASAELLTKEKEEERLSHELLYGIGRQNIRLTWPALYKKKEDELRRAIEKSVDERIIRKFNEKEVSAFPQGIRECSVKHVLDDKDTDNKNTLNAMLKNALPEEKQRISFVNALRNFKGSDFREFWNKHLPSQPEFKDKPELVSNLLLTQQFTLLTGNHQALVKELQVNRKLTSVHQLIEFEKSDWLNVIKKTGVPDFIEGKDDEEKVDRYAGLMQSLLNAAFPTQRIARMVKKDELPIEKTRVSKGISAFLSKNAQFDFAGSRIHDFKKEIKEAAGDDYDEVRNELKKIQRVFQVSTSPEAMTALMENKLHSAYTIASIPRKSFIKTYSKALGGESAAFAIHQRASHISTRAEMTAMHLMEYSHGMTPAYAMGKSEYNAAMDIIKKHFPNPTPKYAELFGSPDICECAHCRSVYSPAAYFVDLLRFLWRGEPNSDGNTPLDMLSARRPDLLHLPLTCENTNTIIPYIDLANEVMEYYTVHGSLTNFEGYDTGEATAEELRANPQNFDIEAYRILSNNNDEHKAVYPFTLPYHQPLDVIRTYSNHLKVSRYEAMKAMHPQPNAATTRAIEAESLGISPEEYTIHTTPDTTDLHTYFGYANDGDFANMQNETDADGNPRGIRPLLERTGLAYTELVELVKPGSSIPIKAH
ncbi:MAG: Tc toxin subunit A, partial [Candidatus Brocadia sp.]